MNDTKEKKLAKIIKIFAECIQTKRKSTEEKEKARLFNSEFDKYLDENKGESVASLAKSLNILGVPYEDALRDIFYIRFLNNSKKKSGDLDELKKIIISQEESRADTLSKKASGLDKLGKTDLALKEYQKALKICPTHYVSLHNIGAIMKGSGDYKKALEYFQKAVKNSKRASISELGLTWILIGKMFLKLKNYEKAETAYKKSIEIRPEYYAAYYDLSCTYSLQNKKDNMLKLLKKAIELEPESKYEAPEDPDFRVYWGDKDFIKLIS